MLRSPLQGLKNKHVECSLQQLNPVFVLIFLAHRRRHSTPNGCRLSTYFVQRNKEPCLFRRFKSTSVLRTTISALGRTRRVTHRSKCAQKSPKPHDAWAQQVDVERPFRTSDLPQLANSTFLWAVFSGSFLV